jgi:hypothetical protein
VVMASRKKKQRSCSSRLVNDVTRQAGQKRVWKLNTITASLDAVIYL